MYSLKYICEMSSSAEVYMSIHIVYNGYNVLIYFLGYAIADSNAAL